MLISKIKQCVCVPLLLTFSLAAAVAQSPQVNSGVTSVEFNSGFISALGGLGVSAAAVTPAVLSSGTIVLPIIGGSLDSKTERGEIIHSGGVQLSAGGVTVQLKNFTIDTTGSTPVLTGLVIENGSLLGRATLFNLVPANFTAVPAPGFAAGLSTNVSVTLAPSAAATLNNIFKTSVLKGGTPVGTATVLGLSLIGE